MKEIRDIKIDMLMGNENPILGIFRGITDGMRVINCDVYNDRGMEFIYYNREREWIFYQDARDGKFWCEHSRYWSVFSHKLGIEYEEMQALTKFLVEEFLKKEVFAPFSIDNLFGVGVEEALKREVGMPKVLLGIDEVGEALNREMVLAIDQVHYSSIGQALKTKLGE